MDLIEKFFQNNNLQDAEDMDSLIELAALVRELICNQEYASINRVIHYTLEHGYEEAFSWCMELLQEAFAKSDCSLENFECMLGKSIPNFVSFTERMQVDLNACCNRLQTVCDHHGEVESFFNILEYKTGYPNIILVSSENFDTKDNDFVQYKLLFSRI